MINDINMFYYTFIFKKWFKKKTFSWYSNVNFIIQKQDFDLRKNKMAHMLISAYVAQNEYSLESLDMG